MAARDRAVAHREKLLAYLRRPGCSVCDRSEAAHQLARVNAAITRCDETIKTLPTP